MRVDQAVPRVLFLLVAGAGLFRSVPAHGTPLFPSPVTETGARPRSVGLVYFDDDLYPDIAVVREGGPVEVLIGTGEGTFILRSSWSMGLSPRLVLTGQDFNGDHRPDLIVASDDGIWMRPGEANGWFGYQAWLGPPRAIGIAAADVDHNGTSDLVLLTSTSLCVMLNPGNAVFLDPACQATVPAPTALAVGDLDFDGFPDVAVSGSTAVALHRGNGASTFPPPVTIATTEGNGSIAWGDFDGDGNLDLVWLRVAQGPAPGATLAHMAFGNGPASFTDVGDFPTLGNPSSIAPGDFDHDGDMDLAAVGSLGVEVLKNPGNRTLQTTRLFATSLAGGSLAVADLDRDGNLDVVTPMAWQSTAPPTDGLVTFLGHASGTFDLPAYGNGAPDRRIASADLNRDGHGDLVVAEPDAGRFAVLSGRGDGSFDDPVRYATGAPASDVVLGDFDEDARLDVAVAGSTGVFVRHGTVTGSFGAERFYSAGAAPDAMVVADVNHDGHADLVTGNATVAAVSVLLGSGKGGFAAPLTFSPGWRVEALAAADVDGDGVVDLVAAMHPFNDPAGGLGVMHGHGDGTFSAPVTLLWGRTPAAVVVADLDADGIPDLAAAADGTGDISLFLGQGGGLFGARRTVAAANLPSTLVAFDLNGDGRPDLITGGLADNVSILFGDGSGGFIPPRRFASMEARRMVVGDFTEDGVPDLVLAGGSVLAGPMLSLDQPAIEHDPIARAGSDRIVECTGSGSGGTWLDAKDSFDVDSTSGVKDDILLFQWFEHFGEPSQILLGSESLIWFERAFGAYEVTLRVVDRSGRSAFDRATLTVADTQPPSISLSTTASSLWPPNHRLVAVTTNVAASDACGPVAVTLDGITSSEPDDDLSLDDGATIGDIRASPGTGDFSPLLRAERSGSGSGRAYTLTYRARDAAGLSAIASRTVTVPHDADGVTEPLTILLSPSPAGTRVEWNPVPGALDYDIAVGDLDSLVSLDPSVGVGPPVCHIGGLFSTNSNGFELGDEPAVGHGFFVVVEYTSAAGPSGYGTENSPYDVSPVVPADICGP